MFIRFRFNAVTDKRQYFSAASEPRRRSRPSLAPLLRLKSALAPDLPLAQGPLVRRAVQFPQILPDISPEVVVFQAFGPSLSHALPSHGAGGAVASVRKIHPVQSADVAVEVPQVQRLPSMTGIEIVLLIIEKGRPGNSAQSCCGTWHWPDIKPDAVVLQPPVEQRQVVVCIRHIQDEAVFAVHRLMGQIVGALWLSGTVQVPRLRIRAAGPFLVILQGSSDRYSPSLLSPFPAHLSRLGPPLQSSSASSSYASSRSGTLAASPLPLPGGPRPGTRFPSRGWNPSQPTARSPDFVGCAARSATPTGCCASIPPAGTLPAPPGRWEAGRTGGCTVFRLIIHNIYEGKNQCYFQFSQEELLY